MKIKGRQRGRIKTWGFNRRTGSSKKKKSRGARGEKKLHEKERKNFKKRAPRWGGLKQHWGS